MSDDGNRAYTEDEFALILRKASELQAKGAGAASPKTGLALRDIKQIAAEVGIDAEYVERAALMARNAGTDRGGSLLGARIRTFMTDEIPAELSESDLGRLIDVVRAAMGSQGTVTEVLDSVEWSSEVGSVQRAHVTLSPRGGVTQIQVRSDQSGAAVLSYVFPIMVAFMGSLILSKNLELGGLAGLGVVSGGLSAGLLTGRTFFKYIAGRFQARIDTLTERLRESGEALAATARPGAPELPAGTEADS